MMMMMRMMMIIIETSRLQSTWDGMSERKVKTIQIWIKLLRVNQREDREGKLRLRLRLSEKMNVYRSTDEIECLDDG